MKALARQDCEEDHGVEVGQVAHSGVHFRGVGLACTANQLINVVRMLWAGGVQWGVLPGCGAVRHRKSVYKFCSYAVGRWHTVGGALPGRGACRHRKQQLELAQLI